MRLYSAVLLLFAATTAGQAATVQLFQGGWDKGGPLSITFTGDETNGQPGYDSTELTAFQATFQLPEGNFATLTLPDLVNDGFFWASPNDYFIKADNAEFNIYISATDTYSLAIFSDWTGSFVSLTDQRLHEVPEPATTALIAASLGALLYLRARPSHPHA